MALEAETLDPLNFDNLAFYVSLAFTTVRVHVIYIKKKIWKAEIEMSSCKFYSNGTLTSLC